MPVRSCSTYVNVSGTYGHVPVWIIRSSSKNKLQAPKAITKLKLNYFFKKKMHAEWDLEPIPLLIQTDQWTNAEPLVVTQPTNHGSSESE